VLKEQSLDRHTVNRVSSLLAVAMHHPRDAGIALRAYSGKSKTAAIKLKCLMCAKYYRPDIVDCASAACPLHCVRPFVEHNKQYYRYAAAVLSEELLKFNSKEKCNPAITM